MTDLVRLALDRALDDATQRVDRARGAIVRMLAGGVPFRSERITTQRTELARAIADRTAARELLRELHAVDGEMP